MKYYEMHGITYLGVQMVAGLTKLVLYDPIRGLTCYELKLKKWQFIWFPTTPYPIIYAFDGKRLS